MAGRQEPVALQMDNSLDAAHTWAGLGLGGMVEVPINSAYKGDFLTHVLNDSGSATLVCEDADVERVAHVAGDLTALGTLVVRGDVAAADGLRDRFRVAPFDDVAAAEAAAPQWIDPADLMACMYTSGTTGRSKGVLISHAHAYTYASREDQARPVRGDRILVTLPLFHLAGQWFGVYQALIHRALCVLEPGFSVSRFWPTVREHGITVTVMLGAMAELLQQAEPRDDDADNPLELAIMAPPASDVDRFRARFRIDLAAVYGMSEIGAVRGGPPETVVGGECGFPRAGYELRLVDETGRDVVSSFEVERVVNAHPDVHESAVVAVPADLTEDEIKAVVVPRPGRRPDPVELSRFLIDRLPYFMVPRYLEFSDELPKTPTQKVHKHLLREAAIGEGTWDREAAGIILSRSTR